MMYKPKKTGKSNAAANTSQIWVDDDIHQELLRLKRTQGRTIKCIAEHHLRKALNLPEPDPES